MEIGFTTAVYVVAAILFILSLGGLSGQESAKRAVWYGIVGMALAVTATLFGPGFGLWGLSLVLIAAGGVIGYQLASKVEMTQMPELVAGMHALVGLAAVFVGFNTHFELVNVATMDESARKSLEGFAALLAKKTSVEINILRVETSLGIWIGAVTFTGSVIAYGKLAGKVNSAATKLPGGHVLNAVAALVSLGALIWYLNTGALTPMMILTLMALFIGYHLIMGIGGADMPVVVSMLNSYSGWAAAAIGFSLGNDLLIVVGALVGSSGAILSYIMCKAMNRSIINVIFSGFGDAPAVSANAEEEQRPIKRGSAEDFAYMAKGASSVIIVPGYGMAVAGAQHAVAEMTKVLEEAGVEVKFAIHPVAGRMPGHMNVLLAEANIDYEKVFELEEINGEFKSTDIVFVVGANDVTNPAAKTDKDSPIYGMPILDVADAASVFFVKRSMAAGYAGVQNELFFRDNTMMIFGDAKKVTEEIVKNFD